jgi:uncharacterized Zn-binding protein involved in type VI secretion
VGQPAAKKGDKVTATDTHIVVVPGTPPTPQALPHPFTGVLSGGLSGNVNVMGLPAATVDSTADNTPAHLPTPPGTSFQNPPSNKGTIKTGSGTVRINGKAAARNGDQAMTCNDPTDQPVGTVVAAGTVLIGG